MNPIGRAPGLVVSLFGLGVLTLASCSMIIDSEIKQCSSTADCLGRGASFVDAVCVESRCVAKPSDVTPPPSDADVDTSSDAGSPPIDAAPALDPWRCVGTVNWPAPTKTKVVDHATFTDYLGDRPIAGLTMEVCARLDVDCATPLAVATTDDEGKADIPLTMGFLGYVELKTAPVSLPDLAPMILSSVPPPYADMTSVRPVIAMRDLAALAAVLSQAVDPARGMVLVTAATCDGKGAEGVVAELAQSDEKTARFYSQNGLPARGPTATDSSGFIVFANVPPGLGVVTTRLARTGQKLGSQTLLVRPGTLTFAALPPTPL